MLDERLGITPVQRTLIIHSHINPQRTDESSDGSLNLEFATPYLRASPESMGFCWGPRITPEPGKISNIRTWTPKGPSISPTGSLNFIKLQRPIVERPLSRQRSAQLITKPARENHVATASIPP